MPRSLKVVNAFLSIPHSISHDQASAVIQPKFQSCASGILILFHGATPGIGHESMFVSPHNPVECGKFENGPVLLLLFYRESVGEFTAKRISSLRTPELGLPEPLLCAECCAELRP